MDSDKSPARLVLQPTVLSAPRASGTQPLVATVIVVGALYFGRDVFVPLALAGLLCFALAPLITALRRRGLPRTPAVITVVILAFLGIFRIRVRRRWPSLSTRGKPPPVRVQHSRESPIPAVERTGR